MPVVTERVELLFRQMVNGIGDYSDRPFLVFLADSRLEAANAFAIPWPSSGSFLGPKTSNAIPKITSKCIG
jgi:hypothetical protein